MKRLDQPEQSTTKTEADLLIAYNTVPTPTCDPNSDASGHNNDACSHQAEKPPKKRPHTALTIHLIWPAITPRDRHQCKKQGRR